MTSDEIMKKLQAPFPPDQIEWRIDRVHKTDDGGYAYVLAYVTNRAIMQRLDEVFGAFNWQNQYKEWKQKGQICGVSVYDPDKKEWVTKWDGADDTHIESTKGGLSDSMKRAAVQWGVGRYLYGLEQCRVDIKARGQNYINVETKKGSGVYIKGYWDEPKLPAWALPEGCKPQNKPQLITDLTRQRVATAAKKLSHTPDAMKDIMQRKFGVDSSTKLTEQQGQELAEYLEMGANALNDTAQQGA